MKKGLIRRLLFIAILVFIMFYFLKDEDKDGAPPADERQGYLYEADPSTLKSGEDLGTPCTEHHYFLRRGNRETLIFDLFIPTDSRGLYAEPGFISHGRLGGISGAVFDVRGVDFEELTYPVWRLEVSGEGDPVPQRGWMQGLEGECSFSDPEEDGSTISATASLGELDPLGTGRLPTQRANELMRTCLTGLASVVPQLGTKRMVRGEGSGIIAHVDVEVSVSETFSLPGGERRLEFGVEGWPGADFVLGVKPYAPSEPFETGSFLITGPAFSSKCD